MGKALFIVGAALVGFILFTWLVGVSPAMEVLRIQAQVDIAQAEAQRAMADASKALANAQMMQAVSLQIQAIVMGAVMLGVVALIGAIGYVLIKLQPHRGTRVVYRRVPAQLPKPEVRNIVPQDYEVSNYEHMFR